MGRKIQLAGVLSLAAALGGFAVIPAIHLIDHDDDHIHVGGAIVRVHDHDHGHADHPDHGPDHDHEDDAPASDTDHGGQSLAHFGAALIEASPPPTIFAAAEPEPKLLELPSAVIASTVRTPRQARAPPAL